MVKMNKIKEILNEIDQVDEEIKQLKLKQEKIVKDFLENSNNTKERFNIWRKCIKKKDYEYYVYLSDPLKNFIDNKIHAHRYETITYEDIRDTIWDYEMENKEANKIKEAMIEDNFGSAVFDW
jgi:flagellar motor switch protein FliM